MVYDVLICANGLVQAMCEASAERDACALLAVVILTFYLTVATQQFYFSFGINFQL